MLQVRIQCAARCKLARAAHRRAARPKTTVHFARQLEEDLSKQRGSGDAREQENKGGESASQEGRDSQALAEEHGMSSTAVSSLLRRKSAQAH